MVTVALFVLACYGALQLLFLAYIQVMAILRVWNNLHWFIKLNLLLTGIAPAFLLSDIVLNIVVGTILFVQWPRWWTLSERLNFNARYDAGWRGDLAEALCNYVLNPFDPKGHHCGR